MTSSRDYNPSAFEPRLAARWLERQRDDAEDFNDAETYYALTMFPYPSGDLHMGHVELLSIHDALVRHLRMSGHIVLNPIGWDAFGLPAENAAKQRGVNPSEWTYANIEQQAETIQRLGYSFDWSRRMHTSDPEYYKWTQWIFLELYEAGRAYRRSAYVNWCPGCETVLANEQVVDGRCERSNDIVIRRQLNQWFFRITDYAEEFLAGLDSLPWPARVKAMQQNWIGKSIGAEIEFALGDGRQKFTIFTTRPETVFGATYFVFAPEHPLVVEHMEGDAEYESFMELVRSKTEIERLASFHTRDTEKRGIRLKFDVINSYSNERVPAYAADLVVADYGTGAIMAAPFADQRDFEFARAHDLPIRQILRDSDGAVDSPAESESMPAADVERAAHSDTRIVQYIAEKEVRKVIFDPDRLINFVV